MFAPSGACRRLLLCIQSNQNSPSNSHGSLSRRVFVWLTKETNLKSLKESCPFESAPRARNGASGQNWMLTSGELPAFFRLLLGLECGSWKLVNVGAGGWTIQGQTEQNHQKTLLCYLPVFFRDLCFQLPGNCFRVTFRFSSGFLSGPWVSEHTSETNKEHLQNNKPLRNAEALVGGVRQESYIYIYYIYIYI